MFHPEDTILRVLENHVKNKKNAKTTIRFLYGDGHTVQRMPGFIEHLGCKTVRYLGIPLDGRSYYFPGFLHYSRLHRRGMVL